MDYEKYGIEKDTVKNILGYISSGDIAIPELQRPFVWKSKQITELIDSLYNGLPTGFIVVWNNDNVKLKDGKMSTGKKIIIDGQQRITALRSALLGEAVITEDYSTKRFIVSYNPFNEKFETHKPVHDKSTKWIKDISIFFKDQGVELFNFIEDYVEKNSDITKEELLTKIKRVQNIVLREIGRINLSSKLSISEATNIFNLMNSKGTKLGQEDYIMAKLSSDSDHDGYYLWKTIDYFCKGMQDNRYVRDIPVNDSDFANTEYYDAIKWVGKYKSNIYAPTYNDVLRVSYSHIFNDGLLKRLSELLSGRNFKTKTIEDSVADETFKTIKDGIFNFVNEHNFKEFNVYIEGTGVKYKRLINSQSTINSAYIMYLLLKNTNGLPKMQISNYVQRWYIMSLLLRRYSGSSETIIDHDLKRIAEKGFVNYFNEIESTQLNNDFWNSVLIQDLETSNSLAPSYLVYCAAQIKNKAHSLFSSSKEIESLIKIKGDIHHIFPKNYLIESGITDKEKYNQVCNYAWIDTTDNIGISDTAPKIYFNDVLNKCTKDNKLGLVKSKKEFDDNLSENCIPEGIINYTYSAYDKFLKQRRQLIAKYIKDYYESL